MKVLVLNAGSSSLKYQVIDTDTEKMLGKGQVERIGSDGAHLEQSTQGKKIDIYKPMQNHTDAFRYVMSALTDKKDGIIADISEIGAIGHRVLHSGEDFKSSVVVGEEELKILHKNAILGPLHMPANISCIESCMELLPGVKNVAVFDTGFHSTMPDYAYMYAIDYADYEKYKIRKYGFHGTSHKYVSGEAIKLLGQKESKIITCHLGNGSSIAAVKDGKCIDTTMGLTPLEGLVMGTRSGDIDAAAVSFLADSKGMSCGEVVNYLNKSCGFLGLAGKSDFRDLVELYKEGDKRAILAAEMFGYRIRKYIGAYIAALNGIDAIVLTGGIGENSVFGRELIFKGLEYFGISFDSEKNQTAPRGKYAELQKDGSKVKIMVIPTNEELVISRDAKELTKNT